MRLAVEIFGKDMQLEADTSQIDITVGSLFEVFTNRDGTRGRRWFDWLSEGDGYLELWFGGRHVGLTWLPARERWRRANQMVSPPLGGLNGWAEVVRVFHRMAESEGRAHPEAA
ncbi:hypothetical protein MZTS_23925 [Methylorubrum zatmanii]|nr:hypothetical protein [Methylorubrum zatmanii]